MMLNYYDLMFGDPSTTFNTGLQHERFVKFEGNIHNYKRGSRKSSLKTQSIRRDGQVNTGRLKSFAFVHLDEIDS